MFLSLSLAHSLLRVKQEGAKERKIGGTAARAMSTDGCRYNTRAGRARARAVIHNQAAAWSACALFQVALPVYLYYIRAQLMYTYCIYSARERLSIDNKILFIYILSVNIAESNSNVRVHEINFRLYIHFKIRFSQTTRNRSPPLPIYFYTPERNRISSVRVESVLPALLHM